MTSHLKFLGCNEHLSSDIFSVLQFTDGGTHFKLALLSPSQLWSLPTFRPIVLLHQLSTPASEHSLAFPLSIYFYMPNTHPWGGGALTPYWNPIHSQCPSHSLLPQWISLDLRHWKLSLPLLDFNCSSAHRVVPLCHERQCNMMPPRWKGR